MAVACSEGGRVDVNGASALRGRQGQGRQRWHDSVYGLTKRMAVVRSEVRVKAVACSVVRHEAMVCLRPGSRTAGGSSTMCLGRQKSERERKVKKLLSVAKESVGPKILGREN
jgi:hypothetical protein